MKYDIKASLMREEDSMTNNEISKKGRSHFNTLAD